MKDNEKRKKDSFKIRSSEPNIACPLIILVEPKISK